MPSAKLWTRAQLRLFDDHVDYGHHLVGDDTGYCYVIYTKGRRRRLPSARIHYLSDAQRFARHLRRIQAEAFRRDGCVLLECDERFLRGAELTAGLRTHLPVPRLFRSPTLAPERISNLYSETVILNLA